MDQARRETGARGPERMAQGDGAAVDVQPVGPHPRRLHPHHRHAGEGLIDLEQGDIVKRQARDGGRLAAGGDRPFEHQGRVSPHHGGRADTRQRGQAETPHRRFGREQDHSRAI
ncbi:hypothetical protein D3C86_1396590 [compost metagenome]